MPGYSQILSKITEAGALSFFQQGVEKYPSIYQNHVTEVQNTSEINTLPWIRDPGLPEEYKGDSIQVSWQEFSQKIQIKEFYHETVIARKTLLDAQTDSIDRMIQQMGEQWPAKLDKDFIALLPDGNSKAAYDGTTFFNDNRSIGDSGTTDNKVQFSVANKDRPTATEFRDAVNEGVAYAMTFLSEKGNPVNAVSSTRVSVIVPSGYFYAARQAANATILENSTNVPLNDAAFSVDTSAWLSRLNSNRFYIHLTGSQNIRGFVFATHQGLKLPQITLHNSEEAISENKGLKISAYLRYAMDYLEPTKVIEMTLVSGS